MPPRKKLSDQERLFLGGDESPSPPETPDKGSLKEQLLGGQDPEPRIRFTVDLDRSVHRRLDQLSLDAGKPKTEIIRAIIERALEELDY
jgi:hypothetical protein